MTEADEAMSRRAAAHGMFGDDPSRAEALPRLHARSCPATSAKVPMKEADLRKAIIDAAKLYGWLIHGDRPARTADGWRTAVEGHEGFPDLVLVRPPRVLVLELKGDGGRIRPMQTVWADALARCPGVEYALVKPRDLDRVLADLGRPWLPEPGEALERPQTAAGVAERRRG